MGAPEGSDLEEATFEACVSNVVGRIEMGGVQRNSGRLSCYRSMGTTT